LAHIQIALERGRGHCLALLGDRLEPGQGGPAALDLGPDCHLLRRSHASSGSSAESQITVPSSSSIWAKATFAFTGSSSTVWALAIAVPASGLRPTMISFSSASK